MKLRFDKKYQCFLCPNYPRILLSCLIVNFSKLTVSPDFTLDKEIDFSYQIFQEGSELVLFRKLEFEV